MMLAIHPPKLKRRNKRQWRKRWVVLRWVTIGGYSTNERETRVFVIAAQLWARRSQSLRRWIFAEIQPVKKEEN